MNDASTPALTRLGTFVAEAALTADDRSHDQLRAAVADCLGCILAGVGMPVSAKARAAVRAMGIGGTAAVLGTGQRTAPAQAAFLNATAGHALDFDDWEAPGNTHPTVVILPALLACTRPGTAGADLIAPYLAGFEVITRLGEALNLEHYSAGWHATATLGTLGATAAVARLMRLDARQSAHAMALAISRATGYTCQFGSNAKPLQAGFAAQAAVECAYLAAAGAEGKLHALDHAGGFAALTGGANPQRLRDALDRLGQPLALSEHGIALKPWPNCSYTHRLMTTLLGLRDGLRPESIARIDLHLPDVHAAILPFHQPRDHGEALFSLPFACAMALVHGDLTLADTAREAWTDPQIVTLIRRTHVHPFHPRRPELNFDPEEPDRAVITLDDGQILTSTCTYPLGAPQNPLAADRIKAKLAANIAPRPAGLADTLLDWPAAPDLLDLIDKIADPA